MFDRTSTLEINRKARLTTPPQAVPRQAPERRVHNFDEVFLGYDPETAVVEASRCLQCPYPQACVRACPAHNNIPLALWLIEQGNFAAAGQVFRQTSNLPEICGRVCPHFCQSSCVASVRRGPVNISRLEAFAADAQRASAGMVIRRARATGKRVAVVGAGPAGLAAAEELARWGHAVTVYEARPRPGGLLVYGIPAFKLSRQVVAAKIGDLQALGVQFMTGVRIGQDLTVDELLARFDAVFLGTGAEQEVRLNIPGETLDGIYRSTDILARANLSAEYLPPEQQAPLQVGQRVVVIGGGDTAMDCLRTALRLGAGDVTCVYRRSLAEMPGKAEERRLAHEEGARFEFLTAPLRFLGDDAGRVRAIECVRMRLGEPDASGRRRPVPVEGSEFTIEVDAVVLALGYKPDPLIAATTPGLVTDRWGLVVANEVGRTSRPGVFAGGDNVRGPDLVVTAMVAGRKAAAAIHAYLQARTSARTPGAASFLPVLGRRSVAALSLPR